MCCLVWFCGSKKCGSWFYDRLNEEWFGADCKKNYPRKEAVTTEKSWYMVRGNEKEGRAEERELIAYLSH